MEEEGGGRAVPASGLEIHPLATIRHIALEPVRPDQPLGIELVYDESSKHCSISSVAGGGDSSGEALVKVGDVLLGVTGTACMGMHVADVQRTIASARSAIPGGALVLHLSEVAIDADVLQEAALQMADAAAQLLGSPHLISLAQKTVSQTLFNPALPVSIQR